MKMLALAAFGMLFVSCSGGGGLSSEDGGIPETEACDQAATAFCAKVFDCTSDSTIYLIVNLYLTTEDNCKTMVMESCGATGFQCSEGETYHGDQAQSCKDQFSGQSCATVSTAISTGIAESSTAAAIAAISTTIPACGKICTGGTDGGAD